MNRCSWMGIASAIVAASLPLAAQQPAPPAPAFAPANVSESGARAMAAACAPCHGTNGRPVAGSTVPPLAGRAKDEIVDLMAQFREGKRPATLMQQIAKGYSDAEVGAMADYFSKQAR
jgi:sulfide dehydrogenase cytochrome subunit